MKTLSSIHTPTPGVVEYLKNRYLEIRKQNAGYSVSAFARDLGTSQSLLSRVLSGDRTPTVKFTVQVAAVCRVSQKIGDRWVAEVIMGAHKNAKISKRVREALTEKSTDRASSVQFYEIERFKAISRWYHLAIVYLTYVKDFKPESTWIARRLGITTVEASDAIKRLENLGLIEKSNGTLRSTGNVLFTNTKKPDPAAREFHTEMANKALEVLKENTQDSFDRRFFSGLTFAIDPARVPEFKEKFRQFEQEVLGMLPSKKYSEVYHLNLQFFPVTKKESV